MLLLQKSPVDSEEAKEYSLRKKSLITRGKQIGSVLFFQGLAFIITFGTNILIIRELSKSDYAIFIICFQMLGMVNLLTDSGITPAFRRLSGKFWKTKQFFSPIVQSLLKIRGELMLGVIPFSLLVAATLFYRQQNGFSWNIGLWILLLGAVIYFEVQRAMYMEILRSQLQIKKVQLSENILNLGRFVLGLTALLFKRIEILLVAYIAASFIAAAYAKAQASKFFDSNDAPKKSYMKVMISKYKQLLPNSIFYMLQSQISLFLLTFFHKSTGVADYGALGRITVIFNMLSSVILNVFATNFGRSQNLKALRQSYLKIMTMVLGLTIVLFTAIYLFRTPIVSILGKKYVGLESLLVQLTFNSCISFILTAVGMLNNAKAWVHYNAKYVIPVAILAMVFGVLVLDFSNIQNIILFSILPVAFTGLLKIADSLRGLKFIKP